MKTVSGKVVSTRQISLSKAAKLISRFTASDNEATPAFAAYLRRTSAAFNELDQLHKEYKIVVGKIKTKKDHSSTGVVTDGTGNSVKTVGFSGVKAIKSEVGGKVKALSDVGASKVGAEVKINETKVGGNLPVVSGVLKKSKKKKGSDGDAAIIVDNLPSVEHAIKASDVENAIGAVHRSEDTKKNVVAVDGAGKMSKKKVLSDVSTIKVAMEVKKIDREVDGNAPDLGGVLKKSKKRKVSGEQIDDKNVRSEVNEERVNCSIRTAEQNFESKVNNKIDVKDEKKHKKKRTHEAEVKDNEHKPRNIETEVAEKKASRKRKHERVADGELAGSQEAVISKKKKI